MVTLQKVYDQLYTSQANLYLFGLINLGQLLVPCYLTTEVIGAEIGDPSEIFRITCRVQVLPATVIKCDAASVHSALMVQTRQIR